MHVYVCICVFVRAGKGVVFVALQEETAIAFCGFFSVSLTYKDKEAETSGEMKNISGNYTQLNHFTACVYSVCAMLV